jgi:long-chain acyl-CoA synthetase
VEIRIFEALQSGSSCAILRVHLSEVRWDQNRGGGASFLANYESGDIMARTILSGLRSTVAALPDKEAAVCGATRYTYSELGARINRLSTGLGNIGIVKGDRVAILSLNCHRYLELYYGVPQIGAVVVPLNFRVPLAELKYVVQHSGARAIMVDESFRPAIDKLRGELPEVHRFIYLGDNAPDGYTAYEKVLLDGSPRFEGPDPAEGDLVGLFYTSGTTGEPKGVMLSHRNIVANVDHSSRVYQPKSDDIYLHAAPTFHLADAATVFTNTTHGIKQVFIPRFEPKAVLQAVSREHVTLLLLVPTMINFVLQEPDLGQYDLSSVRQITYGASPIAPELLRRAIKTLNCRFFQGYGLTEASPLLTVLRPEEHELTGSASARLASCGKAVPGVEVRVVNDNGADIAAGEIGEVIARGPNIMVGYWRRPEDTAAAVRDGWLYTGDLATLDSDGYIYLVDRKKDMIVTGGENVFSTEVEAALYEHPAVKEAAVIGIPDPEWGEAVHACVALMEGKDATAGELVEFCRSRLANYKLPKSIEFFDGELPKGGSGKILKKDLRERYWKGQSRRIG